MVNAGVPPLAPFLSESKGKSQVERENTTVTFFPLKVSLSAPSRIKKKKKRKDKCQVVDYRNFIIEEAIVF